MLLFDAHLHIIDPRFPLIENQGFLPDAFTVADYRQSVKQLNVAGGAVVSGSFQGFDQTYLLDALEELGEGFVGVTQLPFDVSDEELLRLHSKGVRALRFNIARGGSETVDRLDYFARRVHEVAGWHAELYVDTRFIGGMKTMIERWPAVSIYHLGLSKKGWPVLLSMVEMGVKVKATGFGRIDFDAVQAIRAIHAIDPEALLFGTDLPSTRAAIPFQESDAALIEETLGKSEAEKVLYGNAANWYGFKNR